MFNIDIYSEQIAGIIWLTKFNYEEISFVTNLRLSGIVVMYQSTVASNLATSSKPTNQSLVRGNLLVQLKHLLSIHYVSLHPLLILLMRDAEAIGDLHALLVNTTHQGADDSVVIS